MTQNKTNDSLSDMEFSTLDLQDSVRRGLINAKFTYCTPIQALTLPIGLQGGDVAGQAQTGTGKTATFLIALFTQILSNPPEKGRKKSRGF